MTEAQRQQAAALAVLLARHDAQRESLLAGLIRLLLQLWRRALADGVRGRRGVDVLYDDVAVRAIAADLARASRHGQQQTGALAAGFQRQALAVLGAPPARTGALALPADLRGTPQEQVYARPAEQARWQRSRGEDVEVALERAEQRLVALADADVQLAEREAERQVLAPIEEVLGWRRVLRPELSRTGTCGLCIAASDRIYSRGDLRPIHGRCKCRSLPILAGGRDPGRLLNEEDLQRLYQAAGSTAAADLKKVRVQVTQHGELGPVLVDARHRQRGPRQAARLLGPRTGVDGELRALETTLADLERRAAAGEDVTGPLTYQRNRIAQLRALTA